MDKGSHKVTEIGFAIEPKRNCPHVKAEWIDKLMDSLDVQKDAFLSGPCKDCGDKAENWICVTCGGVYCSRYVNGHMAKHNEETHDPIAFSFSDASFWCYDCDSYITSIAMNVFRNRFSKVKFPDGDDQGELQRMAKAFQSGLKLDDKKEQGPKPFTKEELVEGLKTKKFKKIVFLTGAGISVSAGIPDFRTPGTGLYSKLEKYNLPQPEAIFHIEYFKKNPEPFYLLSKQMFQAKVNPVISHKFIKKINDEGMLTKAVTQNIDGLQLIAGLPEDKLIQAHGHMRSVTCIQCKKKADMKAWDDAIDKQTVLKCECGGLFKPDVVFFGQPLPKQFGDAVDLVQQADLVIIMGTSLVVFPFAALASIIPYSTPMVLINNTDSRKNKKPNSLWLDGSLDDRVKEIAAELKWDI